MPLNDKGRKLIKVLTQQHGLKFQGLSQSGVLHYSLTDKARVQAFKSTLRKYRLHYRAENTQQSEETGVYTLKIHTEQDHIKAKLRRQKEKLHKKKSKGKGKDKGGVPRALALMAEVVTAQPTDADIRKALGLSIVEWDKLQDANFAHVLQTAIPVILDTRALVDECQWFFDQLHEHELSTKLDGCLDQIDQLIETVEHRLTSDEKLDRLQEDLSHVSMDMRSTNADLRQLCSSLVNKIVEVSSRPRQALAKDLAPYWGSLSEVWNGYRDVLYPKWTTFAEELAKQLRVMQTDLSITKEAAVNRLVTVQQMLRKNMHYRDAEELGSLILLAKEESSAEGLVPALLTTNGGLMVYLDDCPDPAKPTKYTSTTDKFAFCKARTDGAKCPSYLGMRGENVICASAGTLKQAGSFFSMISELTDEELLEQLQKIAKEDNQIMAIFKLAESRDNKLYYARVSDDRIGVLLDRYPSSKRVGAHTYTVYQVAGEPVFMTNELAICADHSLLADLDKGTPMPRVATVRNAAVMRMTFTSNARMDPNFLDYMRKLNARKLSENTWDVPFRMEADKPRILAELTNDFGYPLQLFELVETPGIFDARSYDICAMTLTGKARLVDNFEGRHSVPSLRLSDRLYDIAAQTKTDASGRLETLAANLRVSNFYVLARKDELVTENGTVGIRPSEGTRVLASDGSVVEYSEGILRDVITGAESGSKPAEPDVEAKQDEHCITLKVTPEALQSLLQLVNPGLIPPGRDVLTDPAPHSPVRDVLQEPAMPREDPQSGTFVTFAPSDGSTSRPKIRFLTPEVSKDDK
jgi:hypothetical protein